MTMTQWGLSTKCKRLVAITALAIGPACADDGDGSSRRPLLQDDDDNSGRPATPVTGMTTYDRSASVPGFFVDISLGGESGEDVVLDWSGTGYAGDVIIYRSANASALLEITLDGPLPAGVDSTPHSGSTSYTDAGAASRSVATPHYFYRVARVGQGNGGGSGAAAYLRSAVAGPPWGQNTNEQAMNMEFGPGSWSDLRYETADTGSLLSSEYSFIYMEGGDSNADELAVFLANNMVELEEWVDAGGTLFLNSAPNEGGNQSWGFGGITLNYTDFPTDPGHAVDASHVIWSGPFSPTATQFTGNYYAHASVSGPGLIPHILDADGGNPNLAELDWGLGRVMFGGLTTSNFWGPPDEALNLRANIIDYLASSEGGTGFQLSTMVMKTTTATYPGFNRFGLCMLDGPASASDVRDQFGDGVVGVHQWNADTQSYMSWTPDNGAPDYPLLYGSSVVAQFDGSAEAYHSLVGVVPTTESLAVTGEPGYNWTTLPVFYSGPTSTDYWLSVAGYWGIGEWHNDTQSAQYDWNDPGYDPFEMEPCGSYDLYLPNNACVDNGDCGEDQFCFFVEPASCGEIAAGLCMPTPLGCEEVPESPVCGCDGETYASQCEAELGGVALRRPEGEIPCSVQPVCGDGNVDPGEQCDGANLAGATCSSEGFASGPLGCTAECYYDTSSCVPEGGGGGFECAEEDIGSAVGNAVTSGSTVGEDEDLAQPCGAGGVDHVIHFVAPSDGTFEFNMIGSSYDTVLSLHAECGGPALTCNDDWYGLQSQVTLSMTAGQQVLIAVSGYAGGTGDWVLNITSGAAGFCGDGNIDPGEQCDSGNLGEASCASEGFAGGELGCNGECTYDTGGCVPFGGGGGESCEGGNDPLTGSEWVVCAADQNQAWVSHSNAGGGNFHPQQICESLGYGGYGSYGGTCGNVCGYCEGATSCEATGSETYDGAGDCGSDAGGPVLCFTVQWQCLGGLPS